eukprot:scaffold39290_cov298-Amphora_coffeaeformis.AAC.1
MSAKSQSTTTALLVEKEQEEEEEECQPVKTNSTRKDAFIANGLDIMSYIVTQLEEQHGVPVAITYGTVLHEIRSATDKKNKKNCFRPHPTDKDIDLVVFQRHWDLVMNMEKNISETFGWTMRGKENHFVRIIPLADNKIWKEFPANEKFQIDVYGFQCNAMDPFVYFPKDDLTTRKEVFLPWKPYKRVTTTTRKHSENTSLGTTFYMPFDPECFLANIYGSDFMTPRDTAFYRNQAYDNPVCQNNVRLDDSSEQREALERQLLFCGESTPETKGTHKTEHHSRA